MVNPSVMVKKMRRNNPINRDKPGRIPGPRASGVQPSGYFSSMAHKTRDPPMEARDHPATVQLERPRHAYERPSTWTLEPKLHRWVANAVGGGSSGAQSFLPSKERH